MIEDDLQLLKLSHSIFVWAFQSQDICRYMRWEFEIVKPLWRGLWALFTTA
jgi:hypothetical protein